MGGRSSDSGMHNGNLITESSSNFGHPGTYELYRAGNLNAPNGMIFLSASPAETARYAFAGVKIPLEGGSYTFKSHESFEQYQVEIKNPLVVSESSDRNNVIAAWKTLHPGQDPNIKTSGLPAKKWQQMDKQNAKALVDSPYDAIIYVKSDGRHEVQIPKQSVDKLKKTNSYKYNNQRMSSDGTWRSVGGTEWAFSKKSGFKKTKKGQFDD